MFTELTEGVLCIEGGAVLDGGGGGGLLDGALACMEGYTAVIVDLLDGVIQRL